MNANGKEDQPNRLSDEENLRWVLRFVGGFPPSELVPLLGIDAEISDDRSANSNAGSGHVWVRFHANEPTAMGIASVSCGILYRLDVSQRLTPAGETIPVLTLPEFRWNRLDGLVVRELPVANFPESVRSPDAVESLQRITLRLEHVSKLDRAQPLKAGAILAELADLDHWIDDASASRLRTLSWCILDDKAIVLGNPLPPIDGLHLCKLGRIFLPAGFGWTPELPTGTAELILDQNATSNSECYHCWNLDNTVSSIPVDEFHALQRAAVRRRANATR